MTAGSKQCTTPVLDSAGNNFEQGRIDVFEGSLLGACDGFAFGAADELRVTLTVDGYDDWKPVYLR